jgi:polyhydroxyalkanoate synthesis repressor PhaR
MMGPMKERVIRKYANRRLYDPSESRHLTLDEVRELVVAGDKIRVEDAKTGEDLTRSILLQIIVEREEAGRPLLSAELLEQLIRFYGGAMQDFLATYLERSVGAFVDQQQSFQEPGPEDDEGHAAGRHEQSSPNRTWPPGRSCRKAFRRPPAQSQKKNRKDEIDN